MVALTKETLLLILSPREEFKKGTDMNSRLRYEYRIVFYRGTPLSMEIKPLFDRKIIQEVSNALRTTNRT